MQTVGCGKSTLVARAIQDIQERQTKGQRVLYFFASKDVAQGSLRDIDETRLKDLQPTLKNVLLTFWDQVHDDEDGSIGGANTKDLSETDLANGIIEDDEIRVTTDKSKADMEKFLRTRLSEKMPAQDEARKEEHDEVQDTLEKIMKRAQGMFLWAAVMLDIVCRAHDKKERDQVVERLLLPKYIQDDYEKLVEGWEGKTARGRLEEWQRKLARQATGLLAHEQGLLSCRALTEVLEEELREAAAQARAVQAVVECCSPFIEYDKELQIFRFAHPSMHDFFVKRDASRTAFADQTLAYLCRPEFRRGPFSGAESWDMGKLRPFLDKHPFLGFAAANWIEAVRNSKAANGQNRKSTRNLLAELYRSDDNLLLAFQVWRIAAHSSLPAQLRSAHIFSFFGLFDNLFSSSSRFTTVHDAALADADGHNALHWALLANDRYTRLQTVRILLPADRQLAADMVAATGSSDLTPLHHAARHGDLGVVRLLLARDPDKRALNVCSKQYGTPLIMAATHGRADVVEELINADADLDVKCDLGNALHAAAAAPDEAALACVTAVLRAHPRPLRLDVNHPRVGTPLHRAAYHGRESVVKLLLDKRFSAREKSWEHASTITAAAAGCHRGTNPEPFVRIMGMLHDAGAKVHVAGTNGYFALHHAAQFSQPEIARFLHNCGADCHEKRGVGTTPLAVAAQQGDIEVVKALLGPREERKKAAVRARTEAQERLAEMVRKRKEEKKKKDMSREESKSRRVVLALWEPCWHQAVAANNMTLIHKLVDLYEQTCDNAIKQKSLRIVKDLAPLGTVVFASVVRLKEPQEQEQKSRPGPGFRLKARQLLSSTTKGVLKLYAFCDTTLSYFQLKVRNDLTLRSATAGTEFHPGVYDQILDRLTFTAVGLLSKAFELDNLDAVPPLAEAWIDALLSIKSVNLLELLVKNRAEALKLILTDVSKTAAEKRREAGILAKVGVELLAVTLKRPSDDNGAARLASSLAKLWATALHDAGDSASDASRVEDIFYVCSAFLEMFHLACELPSAHASERIERVRLLTRVGAEIIVESVKTDNKTLINNMRLMMDAGRKEAAAAGLKDEVEKVLAEKQKCLEAARTASIQDEKKKKHDSVIPESTPSGQDDKEKGGRDGGSNDKSNTRESAEHNRSEGSEGGVSKDESSKSEDGKSETDEEVESKRLRITLRILRGYS
ncbi:putative ankyrin repeat protein [Neofusicoccum parvum UCRNP2]|uniref:Putative ankyrin repeat protein n=1 Tax=Botryosphaeria parva (strain UCR-NP2) TaxID=1287680 RepID=R1E9T2_BOTPV|nr:putative ankyrin repeat protein [Neofusicoccum parvum UCRNP2]